ncbi:sensor histidine kinase [Vitreimonas flagellata]|uniref:sensor histidine kinase n=1 Tax=Vitreimonas flagellata TaxID=2560861 RepID=UPI001431C59D|nr:ATP-binding protein [Vitreimonas flagellata]
MRSWAGALLILLCWQAMFWSTVHVVERAARPYAIDQRETIDFHRLSEHGARLDHGPALAARRSGLEGYVAEGSDGASAIVFLVPFEVRDPTEPLALYLTLREQIREIRVNGIIVQAVAPLPRLEGLITSEPSYYALPRAAIRAGPNQLEIEKDVFGFDTALSEFAIGPADQLAGAYRWRTFLQTDLGMIGIALLVFTALLCLVVNWPPPDRPRVHALVALLVTCALATYVLSFNPPIELSLSATVLIWVWVNVAIALTMTQYSLHDARVPQPRWFVLVWIVLPALASLPVLIAHVDVARQGEYLLGAVNAAYVLVIAAAGFSIVLLAQASTDGSARRWFDRTILALCFSAFAMDRIGSIFDLTSPFDATLPFTLSWSPIVAALLGLSMVLALAREATEARRTVQTANAVLKEKLATQERALADSYTAHAQMAQRAIVLEERQRIVRDMHDGIGGTLLGLKLQIGAGQLDAEAIQAALDAAITDMRLIVDSLDMADESVSEVMRAFESRVRKHIEAAGCTCVVEHALAPNGPALGPRVTLQILRILQEALANALRHSGASQISIGSAQEGELIRIYVRDDGRGFTKTSTGRGLSNMHHRAQAIGVSLEITSSAEGTDVVLVVPFVSKEA